MIQNNILRTWHLSSRNQRIKLQNNRKWSNWWDNTNTLSRKRQNLSNSSLNSPNSLPTSNQSHLNHPPKLTTRRPKSKLNSPPFKPYSPNNSNPTPNSTKSSLPSKIWNSKSQLLNPQNPSRSSLLHPPSSAPTSHHKLNIPLLSLLRNKTATD